MTEREPSFARSRAARAEFGPARPARPLWLLVLLVCLAVGCAGFKPANVPLSQQDRSHGYRPTDRSQHRGPGDAIILLAFSGGGTRAAAFAYGVMEELRDTEVLVDGEPRSLLDEVDTISGVSGGSFPAAYYSLFGNRIFDEFEERFLKKDIQGALIWRILRPWNLFRLMTPYLSRSDLASQYYHEKVFDQATFADLGKGTGPRVHINATDLSSGERFTFNQNSFDIICSDIDEFPIATAVAASSAVPMLLSPITLLNHAGSCGYESPEWVAAALADPNPGPRLRRSVENYQLFRDSERKKFVHLVDGGISDNLGLRASIDFVETVGSAKGASEVHGIGLPDHIVVIVVNAETDPNPQIDLSSAAPSFAQLMNSVSGGQIRRYNTETLALMDSLLEGWGHEFTRAGKQVTTHMVYVGFDRFGDDEERRYYKRMPTSFRLFDKQVDDLREAGRRLLTESKSFQDLLEALR